MTQSEYQGGTFREVAVGPNQNEVIRREVRSWSTRKIRECGMRDAQCGISMRLSSGFSFRIAHSAFRIPDSFPIERLAS